MAKGLIKLRSCDGKVFEVDTAVAFQSRVLKLWFDEDGGPCDSKDEPIDLPDVSSKALEKVIEYCKYHAENEKSLSEPDEITWAWDAELRPVRVDKAVNEKSCLSEDEIKAWDAEFVGGVDKDTLFQLTSAAIDMRIKGLQDLCTGAMARLNADKPREEINPEICKLPEPDTDEEESASDESDACEEESTPGDHSFSDEEEDALAVRF